jgi:hypothetical protein
MKTPTNRIRKDGSTAAALSQDKTSRNHKPKNVCLVVNDETGKLFADFEIPTEAYSNILRDAKANDISLIQWIENAVSAKIQNANSLRIPAATSESEIIPSKIVIG